MQIAIPVENILEDRIYIAKDYESEMPSASDLEVLAVVRKNETVYVSFFDPSAPLELSEKVFFWVFELQGNACYTIESKKEYTEIALAIQNELSRRMGNAEEMGVTA